ncbi:hypothetical protein ABIA33_000515 [Streptacidiphilus sp. MAP12-16]
MARHDIGLGITGARPSVLGGALIDIPLRDGGDDRPTACRPSDLGDRVPRRPAHAEPVGQLSYNAGQKREWLAPMRRGRRTERPDQQG